jgi:hypothetical protein
VLKFLNVFHHLFLLSKLKTRYKTWNTYLSFKRHTLILRRHSILGSALKLLIYWFVKQIPNIIWHIWSYIIIKFIYIIFLLFSLCAGYISGVLQGKSQDECVAMGLKAATSTLMSHRPVPIELNVN